MADFNASFLLTMGAEGGYANHPADRGGETYKGIARNFHPTWNGWKMIDTAKASKPASLDALLRSNVELQNRVREFYKKFFWDVNNIDGINSQRIANEMFDTGVNMGTAVAAKFLQEAINFCNVNQTVTPDILVDGRIGNGTLAALKKVDEKRVLKIMNALQAERYLQIMRRTPSQEVFLNSWFSRVEI